MSRCRSIGDSRGRRQARPGGVRTDRDCGRVYQRREAAWSSGLLPGRPGRGARPTLSLAGRVAQWESARFTRERSQVRNPPRPSSEGPAWARSSSLWGVSGGTLSDVWIARSPASCRAMRCSRRAGRSSPRSPSGPTALLAQLEEMRGHVTAVARGPLGLDLPDHFNVFATRDIRAGDLVGPRDCGLTPGKRRRGRSELPQPRPSLTAAQNQPRSAATSRTGNPSPLALRASGPSSVHNSASSV
jgi:hypothetical protein